MQPLLIRAQQKELFDNLDSTPKPCGHCAVYQQLVRQQRVFCSESCRKDGLTNPHSHYAECSSKSKSKKQAPVAPGGQ